MSDGVNDRSERVALITETITSTLCDLSSSLSSLSGDPSLPTSIELAKGFIPDGTENEPRWVAPTGG